ncbi:MAG: hypothetical protein AAF135_00705 [Bacteroidota bacterium]
MRLSLTGLRDRDASRLKVLRMNSYTFSLKVPSGTVSRLTVSLFTVWV